MTSNNMSEHEPVEVAEPRSARSVDDQLIEELVGRAQAEGLQLTGEGGLLQQLTKRLLESALEGEVTDHLGMTGMTGMIRRERTAATPVTAPAPRRC